MLLVSEENDMVVATDRHYTQGLRLSYFHRDDDLPFGSRWLSDHLPEFGFENVVGRLGYSIGQNIYTPANIRLQRPQPNDRPYAGWLYLGATLQRRGWSFGRHLTEEQFGIEAGVIGPWALAGEAQTWVHDMRDLTEPRGWDNQLKNEPGLRLKYSRGVRFVLVDNGESGIDVIPRIGFSAGNVDTSARAGGMLRIGFNLPDDFGYHAIDALAISTGGRSCSKPQKWSAYFFTGLEGRAVAFNQFIDGAIFHNSPSVNRESLVGEGVAGFAVGLKHIEFGYAHTFRTQEFDEQSKHTSFGSVFLKARF